MYHILNVYIVIYQYKLDLALNNLQKLIWRKIPPTNHIIVNPYLSIYLSIICNIAHITVKYFLACCEFFCWYFLFQQLFCAAVSNPCNFCIIILSVPHTHTNTYIERERKRQRERDRETEREDEYSNICLLQDSLSRRLPRRLLRETLWLIQ